jgi:hypothetical protein
MDDRTEVALAHVRDKAGESMREAGLIVARARHLITDAIVEALGGNGVAVTRGGQIVRLRALKKSEAATAPWFIAREIVAQEGVSHDG